VNERTVEWDAGDATEGSAQLLRLLRKAAATWRPYLGWLVLALCLLLTMLPAMLLWENRWLRVASLSSRLYGAGPLAVLLLWLIGGWRRPFAGRPIFVRVAMQGLALMLGSVLALSQLLADWLPAPSSLWQAARNETWQDITGQIVDAFVRVGVRYTLWWQGVQNNTAGRDDIVFFGFALVIVWMLSLLTGWLARRFQRGLLAAAPMLWLVGLVMLYSDVDRWLIVTGVALALLLHLALEQHALVQRWQMLRLDYNPLTLVEHAMMALGVMALVVALAALTPNLYWMEITGRYYALIAPLNEQLERVGKRAFPELAGVNPWVTGGVAGGLPNNFLLRAGPTASERPVMRVRTSETMPSYDIPPLAHNLRGATFSDYDGRGWRNPTRLLRTEHAAEQPWTARSDAARRTLLQSVSLTFSGRVIYAAGEPLAPSVDYSAEERFPGDLVALRANASSYTVASLIPALAEAELAALPGWDARQPLPAEAAIYLELPESVTPRTRALATTLTADHATLYARAAAIERYLRTFPYDLSVPALPEEVTDVADYFLFDLQRGYCDYYATSFVVLARAAGIPARFVTGFTSGAWNPTEQVWTVTEANAHSWPEVYFPAAGWVPFEPTAGRPELARLGVTRRVDDLPAPPLTVGPPPTTSLPFDDRWLWLLLPGGLLVAGVLLGVRRWRRNREDPWDALLRWGSRQGRAPAAGDTVLEYGAALCALVLEREDEPEARRLVGREVLLLSEEVSALQYAPESQRTGLRARILARWRRLRGYLRRVSAA
jgi:transglutaminase-like putative cysteine protease